MSNSKRGCAPAPLAVVYHQRHDEWQALHAGMRQEILVPDANHIAQEAQRHQLVGGALMLQEEIEKNLAVAEARGEQQVTPPFREGLVDERARHRS